VPIYDQSYAHWEGRLEGRLFRWWPITATGIRLVFRSKVFIVVFCLVQIPFVIRLGMIYLYSLVPALAESREFRAVATVDGSFYHNFFLWGQAGLILICLFAGVGLIARDLKARALEIYFSKPVTLFDYVAGKFGVMLFFLFCVTLFPGLLLFLSDFLLSEAGTFAERAGHLLGIGSVSVIVAVTLSSTVLAASALCNSVRNAAVLWIGFHLTLLIAAAILAQVFQIFLLQIIDVRYSLESLSEAIFGLEKGAADVPWIFPLAFVVLLNLLSWLIIWSRVRGVEESAP